MKKLVFPSIVISASLICSWLIYKFIIIPAPVSPFDFDEASHLLRGSLIAYDLEKSDWLSFLYDTYRQVFWPPLYSWYIGIAFLITGPSIIVAQVTSVLAFIMTSIVLYLASAQMRKQRAVLSGAIASILFLTSPGIAHLAGQAMIEVSGLFAITVTFLIYFKLTRDNSSPRKYMLFGLALTLTYFLKTNYGILLLISLMITQLIEARFRLHRLFTSYNFYTVLPILTIFAVWYAYPSKLIITWQALINYPIGVSEPFSIEGLLYYPRALLRLSGSIWLFSLFICSTLIAFKFKHDKQVRFLLIFVVIQFLLGELHQTKVDRHICPITPPLFLLSGYVIAELWNHFNEPKKIVEFCFPRLLTGLLLLYAINVFITSLNILKTNSDKEVINTYVAKAVRETGTTLIVGMMDKIYPNPTSLDWNLTTKEQLMLPPQTGSLQQIEEERKIAVALTRYHAPAWLIDLILPVISRSEKDGATRSLYFGHPPNANYSQSPLGFSYFLLDTIKKNNFDGVVVITSISGRAPYDLAFVKPNLLNAGLHLQSTRQFEETDIRVDIYKKQ